MRILKIILPLFFFQFLSGQNHFITIKENGEVIYWDLEKDSPLSHRMDCTDGEIFKFDENWLLVGRYHLINCRLEGEFFDYFPSGIVQLHGQYKDFNRDGKWTYFTEEREVVKIELYENDSLLKVVNPSPNPNPVTGRPPLDKSVP